MLGGAVTTMGAGVPLFLCVIIFLWTLANSLLAFGLLRVTIGLRVSAEPVNLRTSLLNHYKRGFIRINQCDLHRLSSLTTNGLIAKRRQSARFVRLASCFA